MVAIIDSSYNGNRKHLVQYLGFNKSLSIYQIFIIFFLKNLP